MPLTVSIDVAGYIFLHLKFRFQMSDHTNEGHQEPTGFTDHSSPEVGVEKGKVVGEKPGLSTSELQPVQGKEK